MEHDHRRSRVHELPSVHARGHGRIRRQRLARLYRADAEARPQVDQHPAEGARAGANDRHRLRSDHVQSLRRSAVHGQGRRRGEKARRRDRAHRSREGEGAQGSGRGLPLRPHLVDDELQLPQIWPFDAHLIDQGWQQTRGQQSCPTGAMRAIKVEDEEMARLAREQALEVMKPELGARPRVYYRNLWRYSKCFIGGTLAADINGVVDCVEGASVRLSKDGRTVAETTSDNYGDFKFDKLDEGSGTYLVEISAKGRSKKSVEARLGASINLGEIRL